MEALGVSWVTFWRHFLKLVFRTLSKRALGGFWAPFGLHFEGSGKGLGRILEGFGENFEAIWRIKNLIFQIAFFDFAFWLLQGLGQKQCALRYHT